MRSFSPKNFCPNETETLITSLPIKIIEIIIKIRQPADK